MAVSNCAIYSKKKSNFMKNEETSKLLSNLGITNPLNDIPLICDVLF